ncbi:MAG TPA: glycosyltransferase family 39 protein [Burkholderiaceae bacterium]
MNKLRFDPGWWPRIAWCMLAVLAFGLRFHALTAQGLWSDELFSVATITQVGDGLPWYAYEAKNLPDLRLGDSFLTWKAAENSPPLFEILLWAWTRVFGVSDLALRAPSALLGSLAPLVLFGGLRRPLGLLPAFLGGLLFALSPSAVAYSQEARSYALLMLLATWATVRLVRYAVPTPADPATRPGDFRVDVLVFVLLSYTHYTGLILSGALAGIRFLFALRYRRPLGEFWWFALVPLLLAPWMALNWHAMRAAGSGIFGWRDFHVQDITGLMLPMAADYFVPGKYSLLLAGVAALAGAAWGMAGQGWRGLLRDARLWLVLAFAATVALHFGYGIYTAFHARVWHPRYFLVMLPLCMTGFALLFAQAGRRRLLPALTTLAIAAASVPALHAYYTDSTKEQYREASRYIAQHTQGRPLVVAAWTSNTIYFNHYLRLFMPQAGLAYDLTSLKTDEDVAALCQRRLAPGTQVVLFQHAMHRFYFEQVRQQCAGSLRLVSDQPFRGLFVDIFEAK